MIEKYPVYSREPAMSRLIPASSSHIMLNANELPYNDFSLSFVGETLTTSFVSSLALDPAIIC
jgi:hypothetical protein